MQLHSLLLVNILNLVYSQTLSPARCTATQKCPESAPCCTQLGFCSSDEISCSLECNPAFSFSTESCQTVDSCTSQNYEFNKWKNTKDSSKVQELEVLKLKKGSLEEVEFFTDGNTELNEDGLTLKMMKGAKGGSRMVSKAYLMYGNITAVLKTGRTPGVVTSFITMSKVKDEIDFEWVGKEVKEVQTNVFYRGQADYVNGKTSKVDSDTSQNWHEYKIEWTPEYIKWYVDQQLIRTYEKQNNEGSQSNKFPSTPSRIEFGLWNGASQAEGTKNWAGGDIDWDSEDIQKRGYFSAIIQSLKLDCYKGYEAFDENGNPKALEEVKKKNSNSDKKGTNSTSSSIFNGNNWWVGYLSFILVSRLIH